VSIPRSSLPASALLLVGLLSACQKSEEHPPFAAGCEGKCPLLPGISVGVSQAGSSGVNPDADAGTGTLQGRVTLLTDDSFVSNALYDRTATISADGASGSPVTDAWLGGDTYRLEGVARIATNWVSVRPDLALGDAVATYQAVQTNRVTQVDLSLVSAATLDGIFTAAATLRSPDSGQVVLFFRSAGTGAPLAGLQVAMSTAQVAMYAAANGWVRDDGTAVTNQSGLVVFGNVEPANAIGTQTVIVTRAATGTVAAAPAGQFAVKVVQGAVTLAGVDVQL
jgi:hypothetical protein